MSMVFSDEVLLQVAIVILGLCGFFVARHIYKHKNNNENPLVCPIRFDCHAVVHSDYSRLFGIPVEILGMAYYVLISLSYLLLILIPGVLPGFVTSSLVIFSKLAFLFSLYLIGIQLFVLKKGCSWCIVSAFISTLIFIFSMFVHYFDYMAQLLHRIF